MTKIFLLVYLTVMLHSYATALTYLHGIGENDLVEWKGQVSLVQSPSWMYVVYPLPNNEFHLAMRMQIQGFRKTMVFHAESSGSMTHQGSCLLDQEVISPGKPFRIILRFTSRSIMVYLNGVLAFIQPVEVLPENGQVTVEKAPTVRIHHPNGVTERFRVLTDEMLAKEMQEISCGTISLGKSIPSFCEQTTPTGNNFRIVGGGPAYPGQNSWQVAIRKKRYFLNSYFHVCGATLIGKCWVVTAAHCFPSTSASTLSRLVVRVGDYFNHDGSVYSSISEFEQSKDVNISKVFLHPEYQNFPIKHDLALVHLAKCVSFNTFVKPACLPFSALQFPERTSCGISGWGASNHTQHSGEYPKCLQTAQVPIITHDNCRRAYGTRYNETNMICAVKNNVDTCLADSGSPLICSDESNTGFTLWGITSWGVGCGDTNHPGVYVRLFSYIRWLYITMKLRPNDKTLPSGIETKLVSPETCPYL